MTIDQATAVTDTTATFNARVNPEGSETYLVFEYGPLASEWCQSGGAGGFAEHATHWEPVANGAADSSEHAVAKPITELAPSTAYCYRGEATNERGTTVGSMVSFTTAAAAAPAGGGAGTGPPPAETASPVAPPVDLPYPTLGAVWFGRTQYSRGLSSIAGIAQIGSDDSKVRIVVRSTGARRSKRPGPVIGQRTYLHVQATELFPYSVTLAARARRSFAKLRSVRLLVVVTVTPKVGPAETRQGIVTLRRPARRPAICSAAGARCAR